MARQALKTSIDAKDVNRRYGSEEVPDPGGMNKSAYPHEIGPHQFWWLINCRRDGNSVIPRGGQFPSLDPSYGLASAMHPWQTHEGAPYRLWMLTSGCPSSAVFGEAGVTIAFFDDQASPMMQGIAYYHTSTDGVIPRDVSIGVFGGLIHVGADNIFRKQQFNFSSPFGSDSFLYSGGNWDEVLKRFGATETIRRQYAFDGLYFLFLRQETGTNDPNDTVDVYVWDSVAARVDDTTTFANAGDFPMTVASADDYLYMVCHNGRVFFRPRGIPPVTWTLLGTAGVTILDDPRLATLGPGYDGQNAGAAHKGKLFFTDGIEAPSVIRSAVQPATIAVERTLPAAGVCRTLAAVPRIGVIYPWHDQTTPNANLLVGMYDYSTNTWNDTAKNLTAQSASFTIPYTGTTGDRIMACSYYRNRIVFMTTGAHCYISPPITIGDPTWIAGTWKRIDFSVTILAKRMRNMVAV
jgi:hypothetical protein